MCKKLVYSILFVLVIVTTSAHADLVHHWSLDEDTNAGATIVADSVGGKDGTINGASSAEGVFGNSLYFDGAGTVEVAGFDTAGLKSMTMTFWMNPDVGYTQSSGWKRIISANDGWEAILQQNTGELGNNLYRKGGTYATSTSPPPEGEWTHVAMTADLSPPGTGLMEIYVNGELDASMENQVLDDWAGGTFLMGYRASGGGEHYEGFLDDIQIFNEVLSAEEIKTVMEGVDPGVTIIVDPNSDIAAANALANPGDTIEFAAGTYMLTSQIEIKDGVTYQGAGAGLTIIDGNDATRAFAAWGDRGATDGQVDANGVDIPNLTGPTDWVLDGLTIQNCVSDPNNRQDILSAARNLLDNYTGTPYTLATAGEQAGAIADNPEAFEALSGGADDDLTDVELQAYLDNNPPGSAGHYVVNDDKRDDGGAVCILNGADGTIRNCAFSNNSAVDDGGAIMVDGQDLDVTIENCAFNLNTCGDQGGAVKLSGAASNSTLTGCSFTENSAPEDDAGAIQMDGAGSTGSVYTLMDCTFTGCSAFDDGGAILATADNSTYVWTNCTFTGNYVTDSGADGGAVRYNPDRANITVTNCSFIGNGMDPNGTPVGDDGGAWKTDDDDCGPMTFMNCLFADNVSKDDRILEVKGGSAILNCTFIGNVAGDEALIAVRGQAWNSTGAVDENGDDIDDVTTDDSIISNCLFINNTLLSNKQIIGDTQNDVFAPTVTNCLFFGNLDQNSELAENIDGNSQEVGTIDVSAVTDAAQIVVDPAGDYHLAADSPAIDASDPATATDADIEGTAAVGVRDVGAYESAN